MNIKQIRRSSGMTQAELARLVGVHVMTVSKWERGLLSPTKRQKAIIAALDTRRASDARSAAAEELAALFNRAFIEVTEVEGMRLSASNQLRGRIIEIQEGPVSSRIVIEVAPRVNITSVITTASVKRLGLRVGGRAVAIIKATEVIIGTK